MNDYAKIPPQNIDIEQLVLGTLMNYRNAYAEVAELLSEDCFYNDFHKQLYIAIRDIVENGNTANSLTVNEYFKKQKSIISISDIANIENHFLVGGNEIWKYAAVLREKQMRRKLIEVAAFISENSYSEAYDVEEVISKSSEMLSNMLTVNISNVKTMLEGLVEMRRVAVSNSFSDIPKTGLLTGFKFFDKRTGGLQPSDLVIMAAETSNGKTSLALAFAKSVALSGTPVAVYSLEMSLVQICARFTSMESGIPLKEILYSKLAEDKFQRIERTISRLEDLPVYIDETGTSSLEAILSSIRRLVLKFGVKLVVVDYLQLVSVKSYQGNKEQQIAYLARKLKNIAKELNITVIALSQLSRDKENAYPSLSRLRDSGQIEEAADIVMLIYRPEAISEGNKRKSKSYPEPFGDKSTKNTALIDVAKGRNIGIFKFLSFFEKETTRFIDTHINAIPKKDEEYLQPAQSKFDEEIPF